MDQKTRFKAAPPEIPETEPFKYDLLGRKENAEILTEFVGSLQEPFVLAVDSPFGTGKTTFIRMWRQHLHNQGFPCLYFNAWENDFSAEPLVSLIGELGSGIEALKLGTEEKKFAQKVFEKTKSTGAALIKTALPAMLKIATSGMLDLSAATEGDIAELIEDVAKKQIEKYQADKKTITKFREQLTDFIQALAKKEAPVKPVIFIVDELDRCRPPYAIELLEKVKHFFSVEGLVFVLAIDRHQLAESVKAMYGAGMDAAGYLRRFIDLEYVLPDPDYQKFVEAQFDRFGLDPLFDAKVGETRYDRKHIKEGFGKLFALFKFSLRVQEQCFTQLGVIVRTTPANHYLFGSHLALLLCLRVANKALYLKYCDGHAEPEEVITFLRALPGGDALINSDFGMYLEAHLLAGIRDQKRRQAALDAVAKLAEAPADNQKATSRAKEIIDPLKYLSRVGDLTGYLQRKIEMTDRFVQMDSKR